MKKLFIFLIAALVFACCLNTRAQSEFSSGLIGVGVVCRDIDLSLDSSGLTDGLAFHVDVLKLQDSPDANQWKLMSFKKEGSHPIGTHIHDDAGMQYITLMVNSLEPFLKRIREHKVKLLGDTPIALDGTNHFVLVQDPDGTFIELIGPLK